MAELEALVGEMEAGKLSLEDSLAAYQRGATLLGFCRQRLEDAEQQVKVLDGEVLQPFNAEAA